MGLPRVKPEPDVTQYSSEELKHVPTVKMDWFFKNGQGLFNFANIMLELEDEAYETEFVQTIFPFFWEPLKWKIIKQWMLPYLALVIV